MRGFCLAILISSLVWAERATFCADPPFPYEAQVSAEQLEVRSGPGWDYYATSLLRRGDKVEVYRHEPGGWLAIRPPEDSCSWIAARHVTMTDTPGIGRINRDAVVAWVGSTVTNVRQHKWQVRLEQDELVEVLGEAPVQIGPGFAAETYYKIAPPAGEFRWLHAQQAQPPVGGDWQVTGSTIQLTDFQPADPARRQIQSHWTAASTGLAGVADVPGRIEQLKIELGLMASRPLAQWDFDTLRQQVAQLRDAAMTDPAWSGQLQALTQRLDEFDRLRQRYQTMLQQSEQPAPESEEGVRAAPRLLDDSAGEIQALPIGNPVKQASALEADAGSLATSRFDAEGWLVPVHSSKRIAPPFAVLDDEGRVRSYASPMPGLNLRRYQGAYVGLYGARRYVESLRASHITVQRVIRQDHQRTRGD